MGLRETVITLLAAAALALPALPACRYQNMQATNADNQSAPYSDLECHLEVGTDIEFQQDVAFSFSPYGCSCNPRMSYAVGTAEGHLARRFELDFELGSEGSSHVYASSDSVDTPDRMFIYNESDPESTMQDIPVQGGTAEEQGIRERMITMWRGLWPIFYNSDISGGGPLIDHMTRVCVEDDITHRADMIQPEGYIFMTEGY